MTPVNPALTPTEATRICGPNTGVLFSEPQIERIDILADKVPA